jgi:hypothetical protein
MQTGNTYPKVYIIILNYNGWADTIECLESVLRNDYPNYQVIVVDNNSPNNSMEYIKAWAEGKLDVWVKQDHPLRHLSFPPVKKPVPYVFYTRKEAEKGGNSDLENKLTKNISSEIATSYPLVFIQTGENLGFAGGNNVGIRYVLAKNDFEYIWFLNNDTVIERDALSKLVQKFEKYEKLGKKIGIAGSKLLYYDNPKLIQGIGGIYNKWFAVAKHLGVFEEDRGQYDNEDVLDKIDYIIGASMLVSKDFIKEVGLMCEDYFLYFEEMDWTIRGKKKGYQLAYCWKSKVYHKEGGSIGSSLKGERKSEIADYYGLRNRIVFTKKFYPKYLWSVYLGFIVVIWNRIRRAQWKHLVNSLKILRGK